MVSSIASTQVLWASQDKQPGVPMMLWEMSDLSRLAPAETCGFYCLWKLVWQIKGSKDSGADCQHYQDINISGIDNSKLSELMIDVHS